ncbi:MAG: gamma-glutamylcyclotransferase family protein [Cyanobacteria bacterium J06639_1]
MTSASHPVFAYGSNLDPQRLGDRAPDWDGTSQRAYLPEHELRFHKRSERYRVAANVVPHPTRSVWGAVVDLSDRDLIRMDGFEGCDRDPPGYYRRLVKVKLGDRGWQDVFIYTANPIWIVEGRLPAPDYVQHVLRGARWHDLPSAYIGHLESTSVADITSERL